MENVAYYRHRQIGWTMIISALIPLFVLFVFGHLASADSQASRALGPARPMFLIALAVPLIAVALFSSLLVSLDQSMLTLRFGPGGLIKKSWPLASIERAEATRTTWTQGWGIHRQGGVTLYNVSGFGAVRITLKDGASALIGSDEPQALAMSIERLVQERR